MGKLISYCDHVWGFIKDPNGVDQERCLRCHQQPPRYSLSDEISFIDGLGTHTIYKQSMSYRKLLRLYLKAMEARHDRPSWYQAAVDHAKMLLKR